LGLAWRRNRKKDAAVYNPIVQPAHHPLPPTPHVRIQLPGHGRPTALLLIKPMQMCHNIGQGLFGYAQVAWADMVAQPIKSLLNPPNKRFV
jgi:hypothetical protein